ncbi:MAG: molybdopterin-dependent oxidoreductase [Eudoraea sp.]|nr:molybdopterin-dependent oxidoreductase [Eudoraea sp.]
MTQLPKDSRRKFLRNMGYIVVGFPLLGSCLGEEDFNMANRIAYLGKFPNVLSKANQVNAWLQVLEDGRILVFSGKVELGQGIRTAIRQVAAEELDMELDQVTVQLAETGLTPNEGYTAGSSSIPNSAMSVRYAAATARQKLLELASQKLNTKIENLLLFHGKVKVKKRKESLTFSEILAGAQIDLEVNTPVPLKSNKAHKYIGKAIPRPDIEKMVRGEQVHIQDLRFQGMVHARVLRPPNYSSQLVQIDVSGIASKLPGILKTVVNGSFVAVITEREYQAVKAENYLRDHSEWTRWTPFPDQKNIYDYIKNIADAPQNIRNEGDVKAVINRSVTLKARYTKPYITHGSMGPACGLAMYDGDILHIWSHSQGIYPLRNALTTMLNMEQDKVHIISVPGAGCYGHSTADDAATDAAILALEYPGKHVRVQWSRQDEHAWDPLGSAIITEVEASLDASGKISSWLSDVWTDSHSTRPNKDAGTLLTARYLEKPFLMTSRGYLGGGHRNSDPYYTIPNIQLNAHYYKGPLRVSSLRSLGAYAAIFSIESFMDELALKAEKDPLEFRLAHLEDERAIAVIQKIQDMTRRLSLGEGEGIGYGFCRYKNTAAYAAVGAKVFVEKATGKVQLKKIWAAVDVGEVINLDGIVNQTEGGMIQAASWTLKEQVTFNEKEITSTDWAKYPVFRFSEIPEVDVAIINRPNKPPEGGGEVSVPPTGAAICNAVYNACGKRIYNLPITPEQVLG